MGRLAGNGHPKADDLGAYVVVGTAARRVVGEIQRQALFLAVGLASSPQPPLEHGASLSSVRAVIIFMLPALLAADRAEALAIFPRSSLDAAEHGVRHLTAFTKLNGAVRFTTRPPTIARFSWPCLAATRRRRLVAARFRTDPRAGVKLCR